MMVSGLRLVYNGLWKASHSSKAAPSVTAAVNSRAGRDL